MVVRHAITFTKHWVPTNEPSQAIYPGHTLKQIHFPPFDFIHATRCIKCRMQQRRCQYTPTQYITLYRLPWLLTRARIHLLHWLVVWVKSWFSFYHELKKLSLYTYIYINIYNSMFIYNGIYIVKDQHIKLFNTTISVHQFRIKMRCPKF